MSSSVVSRSAAIARPGRWALVVLVLLRALTLCPDALALPSFARQTGMPCSQCHTLSFGPALTTYGRQFKLNAYSWGEGEHPMPLALMIQGGFSHVDTPVPEPLARHFSTNDNLSVDQVSMFYGGRISEHSGAFIQVTYSGEDRRTTWDNTDLRYARPVNIGTDAVVGISINNNPTVQDLWNSTPGWGFPYINSRLVPGPTAAALIEGAFAQKVLGATAYAMVHDHVYLEAGAYRGLSDRWLRNVGVGSDSSPHIKGAVPYWRLAYQDDNKPNYFSVGTFGIEAKLQPDPTVPDLDRYTDLGFDATYQYADDHSLFALTVNTSYVHENQRLTASFNSGVTGVVYNYLDTLRFDTTFTYRQTWSAGAGVFDITGGSDATFYGPAPLAGSNNGSPDTRGYILQFEYVPLGKEDSWAGPWVNIRLGLQYTGYLKFNGGTSNYDGYDRSARRNNSLFLFYWMAF